MGLPVAPFCKEVAPHLKSVSPACPLPMPRRYTAHGGLKATFLSAYLHTIIIFVALCIFTMEVYNGSADLGSPSKVRRVPFPPSVAWHGVIHAHAGQARCICR